MVARATVTLGALKPGLVVGDAIGVRVPRVPRQGSDRPAGASCPAAHPDDGGSKAEPPS
ncbi:MAG: hypothetical protein ACRDY2_05760 [Acidimicrobiales bacterium]